MLPARHVDGRSLNTRLAEDHGFAVRLRQALRSVADQYDWVVIDTMPSFSRLTTLAMVAATDIVIRRDAFF